MCESSVYLIQGPEKALVMEEAVRVHAQGPAVVCINALGERKIIDHAEIAEASVVRHEILLRPRRG